MSDMADLQKRVQTAGQRFGMQVEQDRDHSARLSTLLAAVEEGFVRSGEENRRLKEELGQTRQEHQQLQQASQALQQESQALQQEFQALQQESQQLRRESQQLRQESQTLRDEQEQLRQENVQLQSLLQNLLHKIESDGHQAIDDAIDTLEQRISRLVATPIAQDPPQPQEPQAAQVESDKAACRPESVPQDAQSEPAEAIAKPAATAEPAIPPAEGSESDDSGTPGDDAAAPPADRDETPVPVAMPAPDTAAADQQEGTTVLAGAPSEDDISAVNKIIQRISLLTGELRDAGGKDTAASDPGSAEDSQAPEKRAGRAG